MPQGAVRIGCSGWNYADWRGRFYPAGLPARRWLAHYATLFDTVEVNSTFYRLARPAGGRALGGRHAAGLRLRGQGEPLPDAHAAPDRHGARRGAPLRGHRAARRVGASSARCCGSSRRTSTATTTGSRFALERLPPGRHCFEFRHPSWFAPVYGAPAHARRRAGLRRRPAPALPGRSADRAMDASSASTTARAGGAGNYSETELREWAARLRELRAEAEVFAYFNNDWEGFAVRNARRLRRSWRVERPGRRCYSCWSRRGVEQPGSSSGS